MSVFTQPPMHEPPELEAPEPTAEPSPGMKKVQDFGKTVHLASLVERARRTLDEVALFASTAQVWDEQHQQFVFDIAAGESRKARDACKELGLLIRDGVSKLGIDLADSVK